MDAQRAGVFLCVVLCCVAHQVGSQPSSLLEYRIMEELPRGTLIGNIVNDARLSQKYTRADLRKLRFSFLDQPDVNFNAIDIEETTGMLRISRRIDRDAMCPHQPVCEVFLDVAVGPAQYFQVINMKIEIMDSNDNRPTFPQKQIRLEISEATPAGMGFALPLAEDPDSGSFTVQMYELASRSMYFDIRQTNRGLGETDLKLVLRQQLDREQQDFYEIKVAAFDGGVPAKSDKMTINITVTDANDNRPKFDNQTYSVLVAEDAPFNHTILRVHATDRDIGANGKITYGFTDRTREHYGGIFGINPKTGEIYLKRPLDFEKESVYHLVVSANDGGPKLEPGTAAVIVNVRDVNDNAPQVSINTLTPSGRAEVEENSAIGAFVAHISAKDQDSGRNGEVVCFMTDSRFHLEQLQGTQYKIVTGIGLDREKEARFEVMVTCQDLGDPRQSTTETITVTVLDKNDHAPSFSKKYYSYRIRENNRVNAILVTVNATDRDKGSNAIVTYRLPGDSGSAFKIHPTSGAIRANIQFDFESKEEYRFHVIAEDRGTPRKTSSAVVMITILDVNDEVPKFQKQSYSFKVNENQGPHKTIGIVSATDRDAEPYNRIRYTLAPIGSTDYFEVHAETGRIITLQKLDREKKPIHYLTVEASNPGFTGMTSSVSVTIHVIDENDNGPVIDFPTDSNNTIYLPNHLPLDYVVTRIIAHDEDDPQTNNAKMAYTIANGNEDRYFKMDVTTGAVSVDSDLGSIESALFTFKVHVRDLGPSQHLSATILNIVVNKSLTIDFIGQPAGLTAINRTIVIALTIASAIVMAILIVAIIIIKSCDGRDRKGSRTKKNAQNILSNKDTKEGLDSHHISNNSTMGSMDGSLKKEVTFNIKMEEPPLPPKRQYPPSPSSQSSTSSSERNDTKYGPQSYERLSQHPVGSPELCRTMDESKSKPHSMNDLQRPEGQQTWPVQRAAIVRTLTPSSGEPECRHVVHMLKPDQQPDSCSESACSADISVTDSGKGPSEEGEQIEDINLLPVKEMRPLKPLEKRTMSPTTLGHQPSGGGGCVGGGGGKGLGSQKIVSGPPGTLPKAKHCYSGLPKHHTFLSDELYGPTGTLPGFPVHTTIARTKLSQQQHQQPFRSQSFNGMADPRNFKDDRPLKNRVTFLDQRNNQIQNGLKNTANSRVRPVKLCVTILNDEDQAGSGSENETSSLDSDIRPHDHRRLLSRAVVSNMKTAHDNTNCPDRLNYSSDWTNDDDDATTTSGSYVVDPDDLGIEIEAALANMDARSSNV